MNFQRLRVQMMFNIRRKAMERRRQLCAQPGASCPPLTWTISNRLAEFAPFLLQWYFRYSTHPPPILWVPGSCGNWAGLSGITQLLRLVLDGNFLSRKRACPGGMGLAISRMQYGVEGEGSLRAVLLCRQAGMTGRDSFLLGPSGYGFLHPSLIHPADPLLPAFVNRTEAAAALLATSAYVHWDDYDNGCSGIRPASVSDGEVNGCRNELDMERYLRRLAGTNIKTVFSPILPFVPRHIGELATFRELYRWFGTETGASLAHRLGKYRRGTVGYVYMIPGVSMDSMEELGRSLPDHVELVGYRELADVSRGLVQGGTAGPELGAHGDHVAAAA